MAILNSWPNESVRQASSRARTPETETLTPAKSRSGKHPQQSHSNWTSYWAIRKPTCPQKLSSSSLLRTSILSALRGTTCAHSYVNASDALQVLNLPGMAYLKKVVQSSGVLMTEIMVHTITEGLADGGTFTTTESTRTIVPGGHLRSANSVTA